MGLLSEGVAWEEVERQATDLLSRYIRFDTTNPPGNEAEAAQFLAQTLSDEGIDSHLYEPAPGRANLVARLSAAEPVAPPLLLMHHIDVVPADGATWTRPPFHGLVREGHIWGRGALDDKGLGVIHLMALVLLKRLDVKLTRDIVFMAVSDEEEGGAFGAQWMIEKHWPDIECEYVWDEGGTGSVGMMGRRPIFAVSVWEKRSMLLKLTARGLGGHGSIAGNTPLDRLVRALHAVQGYSTDMRFNGVTREFFERISRDQGFIAGWLMRHAETPVVKGYMARQIKNISSIHAMLRDTITATVLSTGDKPNVVDEQVEATLDVRLLPDTDRDAFLDSIRRAINDDAIELEATGSPKSGPPSPVDSELFRALSQAIYANEPAALVTPMQTPYATDSRFFRERGVAAYGLLPVVLTGEELASIHGVDERMSVKSLTSGIKIALDAVGTLCS
ncbi:MAG: M20/M25/M40 family metallo-hydrolase [Chloroflexi bacterium]|nr:M20/M25/M40 family metallo-hydrolase [Chloroflexota bacterium]